MQEVLPDTAITNDEGHLEIGGCDALDLVERFGTPLIVLDRTTFVNRADAFSAALSPEQILYAGKSFICVAVCRLLDELGLSLDVCTGGELATAKAASFPPERILFHGNNKSEEELEFARDYGVGRIVVDSFDEIERAAGLGLASKLLVRVTPGVEAHTHEYVQTGQEDSKFGFTLAGGVALEALRRADAIQGCELVGIHAHIGSQIFELTAFDLAIERMTGLLVEARKDFGFEASEVNLGGGLGIAHTRDEMTPHPTTSIKQISAAVEDRFFEADLPFPRIFVEPGRAVSGAAGVTLYRVGTVKQIPGVRTYVSVDGGMSDNIRPALYGARYEAMLANRMNAQDGPRVTIAGKHCESGDVLIKDVHLPEDTAPGDIVCIPATGAYTYSMASNYNRQPRPAVVMVHEGNATEIVRRESYEDLLRLDR